MSIIVMKGDSDHESLSSFEGQVVYKSSNERVATIDENGVITAVGIGECKAIGTAIGDYKYKGNTIVDFDIAVPGVEIIFPDKLSEFASIIPLINNQNRTTLIVDIYPKNYIPRIQLLFKGQKDGDHIINNIGVGRYEIIRKSGSSPHMVNLKITLYESRALKSVNYDYDEVDHKYIIGDIKIKVDILSADYDDYISYNLSLIKEHNFDIITVKNSDYDHHNDMISALPEDLVYSPGVVDHRIFTLKSKDIPKVVDYYLESPIAVPTPIYFGSSHLLVYTNNTKGYIYPGDEVIFHYENTLALEGGVDEPTAKQLEDFFTVNFSGDQILTSKTATWTGKYVDVIDAYNEDRSEARKVVVGGYLKMRVLDEMESLSFSVGTGSVDEVLSEMLTIKTPPSITHITELPKAGIMEVPYIYENGSVHNVVSNYHQLGTPIEDKKKIDIIKRYPDGNTGEPVVIKSLELKDYDEVGMILVPTESHLSPIIKRYSIGEVETSVITKTTADGDVKGTVWYIPTGIDSTGEYKVLKAMLESEWKSLNEA